MSTSVSEAAMAEAEMLSESLGPEDLEYIAGKLLVASAQKRKERDGPQDAHEIRHLQAAVVYGDSTTCYENNLCTLIVMRPQKETQV